MEKSVSSSICLTTFSYYVRQKQNRSDQDKQSKSKQMKHCVLAVNELRYSLSDRNWQSNLYFG